MNWLEKINNIDLEVTTGDGKTYKPLWLTASKVVDFNAEIYEFIGIKGSYVERKEIKGNKFSFDFIFQGEDYLDVSKRFEISAANKNPWKIIHPFYGKIVVQPLSLEFDNSKLNLVTISGTLAETIELTYPKGTIDLKELVTDLYAEITIKNITIFKNIRKKATLKATLKAPIINDTLYKDFKILTKVFEEIEKLKDLLRKANAAVQTITTEAGGYISKVVDLINFPFLIKQDIEFKMDSLIDSYNSLKSIILQDNNVDIFQYNMLQTNLSSIIASTCGNLVTAEKDNFKSRKDIYFAIEKINLLYNDFIVTFDGLNFDLDAELLLLMDNIVNTTISNLYKIAFNSKQERMTILEQDDNIINLAYRFYGAGDENLKIFIERNNINLDEHLQIPKGRKIIWYL